MLYSHINLLLYLSRYWIKFIISEYSIDNNNWFALSIIIIHIHLLKTNVYFGLCGWQVTDKLCHGSSFNEMFFTKFFTRFPNPTANHHSSHSLFRHHCCPPTQLPRHHSIKHPCPFSLGWFYSFFIRRVDCNITVSTFITQQFDLMIWKTGWPKDCQCLRGAATDRKTRTIGPSSTFFMTKLALLASPNTRRVISDKGQVFGADTFINVILWFTASPVKVTAWWIAVWE